MLVATSSVSHSAGAHPARTWWRGLAGALGGMGGQSAFGTKAGDLFTKDHDWRRYILDSALHSLH